MIVSTRLSLLFETGLVARLSAAVRIHEVKSVVMILEAWATPAKPGQPLDMSTPPSEAFDHPAAMRTMAKTVFEAIGVTRAALKPKPGNN